MATYYFRNTGSTSWNVATNWSTTDGGGGDGAVPTSADDILFTNNSGNVTTNVAGSCKTVNFTGYTNTITMSNPLNVSGNVTLGAGMNISGSSNLNIIAAATLTSNGKTWTSPVILTAIVTYTLADNWTVNTLSIAQTAGTQTINGFAFNVNQNFNSGVTSISRVATGTTVFNLTGTGTWNGVGLLKNNLNINTGGTITLINSGNIRYDTGTITYVAGTVISTNNTLILNSSCTLNTNGMSWGNIDISVTQTVTINSLLSAFSITISTTSNITFTGTSGFIIGKWNDTNNGTSNKTRTFQALLTYTVTTELNITGVAGTPKIFTSSSGTNSFIFTLQQGATVDIEYCNVTRSDASNGKTIWNFKGVLTTAPNWKNLVAYNATSETFVN